MRHSCEQDLMEETAPQTSRQQQLGRGALRPSIHTLAVSVALIVGVVPRTRQDCLPSAWALPAQVRSDSLSKARAPGARR